MEETNKNKLRAVSTIILAEDDSDDQGIFQTALEEIDPGVQLHLVSNGLRLLELLRNYYPDLLFLDLEMPYKNGLECLVEIRNDVKLHDLPVVVFSSTMKPSNIQTAYEMGAHLFFIKPPIYQDYISSIRNILELDWTDPASVRENLCKEGKYRAFNEETFK